MSPLTLVLYRTSAVAIDYVLVLACPREFERLVVSEKTLRNQEFIGSALDGRPSAGIYASKTGRSRGGRFRCGCTRSASAGVWQCGALGSIRLSSCIPSVRS